MSEHVTVWVDDLPDLKRGEEIVRCRGCANYHDGTVNGKRRMEPHCRAIGALAYGALFEVGENDFCAWGERREQ